MLNCWCITWPVGFKTVKSTWRVKHEGKTFFTWLDNPSGPGTHVWGSAMTLRHKLSLGLLWMSENPEAETTTWQHTTLTWDIQPCPPVGYEPTIPASKWPQPHALDRATTGMGSGKYLLNYISYLKDDSEIPREFIPFETTRIDYFQCCIVLWYSKTNVYMVYIICVHTNKAISAWLFIALMCPEEIHTRKEQTHELVPQMCSGLPQIGTVTYIL